MATQYLVSPSSRGKKARIWQEDRHQRIRILLSTFKGGTHSIDVALKMRGAPEEPRANEVILLGGLISERILSTVGMAQRITITARRKSHARWSATRAKW